MPSRRTDARPLPSPGLAYRLLGRDTRPDPSRRLGCGVIDKSAQGHDHLEFTPAYWAIQWVLRGAGTYVDDAGKRWEIAAGDCFIRFPGRRHSTMMAPGTSWLEVFIDLGGVIPRGLLELGLLDPGMPVWHLGHDPRRLDRWLELRSAIAEGEDQDLGRIYTQAQALAIEALATARPRLDAEAIAEDAVAAACRLLAEDPGNHDPLEGLCRRLGLGYEILRKRFQRQTGLSPSQYRIRRRMERACALLRSSQLPVGEIAGQLGYASAFAFSSQFRRTIGCSPLAYRQS